MENKAIGLVSSMINNLIENCPDVYEQTLSWEPISIRELTLELMGATLAHVSNTTIDAEDHLYDLYLWFVTSDSVICVVHIYPNQEDDDITVYTSIQRASMV